MNSLNNNIQLIGRLGSKPELKDVNGTPLATVSIATSNTYTNKQREKVENTDWHTLKVWGKQAEIFTQYTDKGHKVAIQGRLTYDKWQDKAGNNRERAVIVVNQFLFLEGKGGRIQLDGQTYAQPVNQSQPGNMKPTHPVKEEAVAAEDDLPF